MTCKILECADPRFSLPVPILIPKLSVSAGFMYWSDISAFFPDVQIYVYVYVELIGIIFV